MISAGIGPASAVAKRRLLTIWVEPTVLFVMLVVAVVSGSLQHYEFGLGKREQAGNFAIALILVVAGRFVADKVFSRFLTGDEALTQFDRAGSKFWAQASSRC